MRVPKAEIDRIKRETDLAALVRSRGVELKPHGKDLVGRCPFHFPDMTPSFVVSKNNLWNCLGACGTGGSVIDFVMKIDNVSFPRAVELLRKGELPAMLCEPFASAAHMLHQVVEHYHACLKATPAALAYLESRGINDAEAITAFKLGFVDRSLLPRLPSRFDEAGQTMRLQLGSLGVMHPNGRELFLDSVVFPIYDERGAVGEIYGRKIDDRESGDLRHCYLPGPHRGIWNPDCLGQPEIILCESIIDALSFWTRGFKNVTSAYGVNGFTDEMMDAFVRSRTRRVYVAYDADEAGDRAVPGLARKLTGAGIECRRVKFPKGTDANDFVRRADPNGPDLDRLLAEAEPADAALRAQARAGTAEKAGKRAAVGENAHAASEPAPLLAAVPNRAVGEAAHEPGSAPPAPPAPSGLTVRHSAAGDIETEIGERRYRIRGLSRNATCDIMKINLRVARGERFHVDTLDLYGARARASFIKDAAKELELEDDIIKSDLSRVLLKLEELQEERMRGLLEPAPAYAMSAEERKAALHYLKNPRLLDRIADDFEACGLVGERENTQVGYLAALSRKMDSPLAIIIQSSSAAGKSAIMDAILAFIPPEDVHKYSAVTGQSLFYFGEKDMKHKILAIAEEEGAGADRAAVVAFAAAVREVAGSGLRIALGAALGGSLRVLGGTDVIL